MPQPATKRFSIFISYRREDSGGHTGRIYDGLAAHFGEDRVFFDRESIEPGESFKQAIEDGIGSCQVLVVVIGKHWLFGADGNSRRLDNPNDLVRLEIAAALRRNIGVFPVLVQGATMPGPEDLPAELSALSHCQAIELSDGRWKHDLDPVITAVKNALGKRREEAAAALVGEVLRPHRAAAGFTLLILVVLLTGKIFSSVFEPERVPPAARLSPSTRDGQQFTKTVNGVDFTMAWISGGQFEMGSPAPDPDSGKVFEKGQRLNEWPPRSMTVQSFYMGIHEVTQEQWDAVMKGVVCPPDELEPSPRFKRAKHPMENVSWVNAVRFCERLSRLSGLEYRLPTEAEWEYAARAGTRTPFALGDGHSLSSTQATFNACYPYGTTEECNEPQSTTPVGLYKPNGYGLYDMHGNVWEWCRDTYLDRNALGDQSTKVLRGGSWRSPATECRSAFRLNAAPTNIDSNIGSRVVVSAGTGAEDF